MGTNPLREPIPDKIKLTVKNNYVATAAPTINDDDTRGYSVGSQWYDTVLKILWTYHDATTGAAHWNMLTKPDPQFFQMSPKIKDIKDLFWKEIQGHLWDSDDFDIYGKRKLEFIIDINASTDTVSVRLYDVKNAVQLGILSGISTSGLHEFTFTKPTSQTTVQLQVIKDTDVSTDPLLESALMELEGM